MDESENAADGDAVYEMRLRLDYYGDSFTTPEPGSTTPSSSVSRQRVEKEAPSVTFLLTACTGSERLIAGWHFADDNRRPLSFTLAQDCR